MELSNDLIYYVILFKCYSIIINTDCQRKKFKILALEIPAKSKFRKFIFLIGRNLRQKNVLFERKNYIFKYFIYLNILTKIFKFQFLKIMFKAMSFILISFYNTINDKVSSKYFKECIRYNNELKLKRSYNCQYFDLLDFNVGILTGSIINY